jgi:hypothetical protein
LPVIRLKAALGLFSAALDAPEVYPDLVLVPLIAVDARGTRLGQGKGHYDRVLAKLRERAALLIGVGWEVQRLDRLIPPDPWDVALDGFASSGRAGDVPVRNAAEPSWRKPAGIFPILALIAVGRRLLRPWPEPSGVGRCCCRQSSIWLPELRGFCR